MRRSNCFQIPITMKVSKGDVSSQLSIESGGISHQMGNRFSWEAEFSSLTPEGKLTVIDGLFKGGINVADGIFTVEPRLVRWLQKALR